MISSIINGLPLFSDLSPSEKEIVASRSRLVEFKKGEIVYREGDRPDYFYCMVNGRVEIYHPANKAKGPEDLAIERIRRGDYFGSISSLTGQPHSVSARVLNDSAILRIGTKDFNYILHKIPRLAILLSRTLSRRLRRKGIKEIFESTIIAVYDISGGPDSSRYAKALRGSLVKESGKKVLVVKPESISGIKKVSSELSSLTRDYHYVLVDVSPGLNGKNFEILKQADMCHILSPSDRSSLRKTSFLIKRLESSFSRCAKWALSIILKEDRFYARSTYADKIKILSREIFASLPGEAANYKKAVRRIAREASGVMIGLVLGSGAAMGLAHIGVLKVLEKEKIPVDIISATSIGALVAGLWAAGHTAKEIEKLACSFKSRLRTLLLIDPTLPVRGLIKGRAVKRILKHYLGNKTFFDVKIPLKIVACDIKKRREFIIDKGSLVDAVMASIAIPGVFEPVEHAGSIQLVDGGIVNPLPISVLSKSGIKKVIACNTLPSPEDMVRVSRKRLNIYDVIINSFQAVEYTMALQSSRQADVYLHPIPKLADWYELYKAKLFIKTGREHARNALPEIKRLIRTNA